MTIRTVVCCDGVWPGDRMPCRGAFPTAAGGDTEARLQALAAGWTAHPQRGDLCPAHSAMHKRGTT